MVEGKPNVKWTSDFRGFKSRMPINKGTKVTTLDKQASKTVKNIKKQAIATQACEKILEEIVQRREEEETRDARAAALEEAKEVANDPFAKAEAAKNFDPSMTRRMLPVKTFLPRARCWREPRGV
jgi:hypothetical protein